MRRPLSHGHLASPATGSELPIRALYISAEQAAEAAKKAGDRLIESRTLLPHPLDVAPLDCTPPEGGEAMHVWQPAPPRWLIIWQSDVPGHYHYIAWCRSVGNGSSTVKIDMQSGTVRVDYQNDAESWQRRCDNWRV